MSNKKVKNYAAIYKDDQKWIKEFIKNEASVSSFAETLHLLIANYKNSKDQQYIIDLLEKMMKTQTKEKAILTQLKNDYEKPIQLQVSLLDKNEEENNYAK